MMADEVNELGTPPVLHDLLDEIFKRLTQEVESLLELPEDELVEQPIWVEGLLKASPIALRMTLEYYVLEEEEEGEE